MLTKINKNVIIENVDKRKQGLRKSEFAGKIKQKIFFKKLLTRHRQDVIIQKLPQRQRSTLKSKQ